MWGEDEGVQAGHCTLLTGSMYMRTDAPLLQNIRPVTVTLQEAPHSLAMASSGHDLWPTL